MNPNNKKEAFREEASAYFACVFDRDIARFKPVKSFINPDPDSIAIGTAKEIEELCKALNYEIEVFEYNLPKSYLFKKQALLILLTVLFTTLLFNILYALV